MLSHAIVIAAVPRSRRNRSNSHRNTTFPVNLLSANATKLKSPPGQHDVYKNRYMFAISAKYSENDSARLHGSRKRAKELLSTNRPQKKNGLKNLHRSKDLERRRKFK